VKNCRILIVDDNRGIHDDFRKILTGAPTAAGLDEDEAALFGMEPATEGERYIVDSAYQGPQGAEMVRSAAESNAPYAVAFVDMRMPPSWDGVQTIEKIWDIDRDIQIVLCTAYSDYSWGELKRRLGPTDRFLLLKKPFDVVEVRQLACALTEKWQMARHTEALRAELVRDITRRKEIEKLKDEFVSTVSHELRTPLTSIRGALGLLEGGITGSLSEEAQGMVQIARVNADRLIRLINDLLDLEKIEAGKLEMKTTCLSVPRLIASTLDGLQAVACVVGVELHATAVAPERVEGDEDRLVQVLTNLVSNAIKFSPRDGIIELRAETTPERRIRFSVTDQGQGIAESHRKRLFSKFHQVDSSDSRGKGGTGLGLAISKAIVEQHGGEIGMSSRVGHGSTFWFELPRVGSAVEEGEQEPEEGALSGTVAVGRQGASHLDGAA
jgi:two-component system sensor histidine kinase/response regulator